MIVSAYRSAWLAIGIGCAMASPVLACKYTVRDVGFVDLGAPPYRVYMFVRSDTPQDFAKSFQQMSVAALMDSNVGFEVVNVDGQREHPAVKYVETFEINRFPAAMAVSPDDEILPLPVPASRGSADSVAWSWLESLVVSQARTRIQDRLVQAYCVVLLIDGEKPAENEKALRAATGAIKDVAGVMDQMPKPTKEAPALVRLSHKRAAEEKVLLWSLGLDPAEPGGPFAAVIYGRGRWIGPIFESEGIAQSALVDILSLIGGACECGLDREQMLGVMLPMRWDDALLAKSARSLGFDPENPVVKAEVSRILSMAPGFGRGPGAADGLLGYTEQVVQFKVSPTREMPTEMLDGAEAASVEKRRPSASQPASTRTAAAQQKAVRAPGPKHETAALPDHSGLGPTWAVVVAMAVAIIAAGVFVILRAQRRAA